MPVVLEETEVKLERADLEKRVPIKRTALVRSPGIHLSGVLRYIAETSGILRPVDDLDEELPLRMVLGLAWEEFAVSLYPAIFYQPGEAHRDGVAMTCDGIDFAQADGRRLEEFKATWKRVRSGEQLLRDWLWMHQGRGYCKGYGVDRVRWHVYYVNGDYRGSGPIYMRYLVEFTAEEIDQTWYMVLANRDKAEPE